MKQAPDDLAAADIAFDSGRTQSWLDELQKNIQRDFEDRSEWVQAREHFFSRRYCLEWRNPTTPWIGSSNVVLPLIDKKIDELKPQYVNMILAAKPPVSAEAVFPQFQKKTKNVELLYEWLVHYGSPRFAEETILGVDDCLETGRAIIRDYWHYETRQTPTYLTAARLPDRLKRLIVMQFGGDAEADSLFVAAGGMALPPGQRPVVMTKKVFDRMRDPIKEVVMKEFDLDEEEPRDKKAIERVMAWLRSGAKEPLKFESRDIIINVPAIRAINPIDYVVPQNATSDPEDHERSVEVMYFTAQQLKAFALDQKLNKASLDHLFKNRRKRGGDPKGHSGRSNWQRNIIDIQQAAREGITGDDKDDLFEIWKVRTRLSMTEGGPEKKVVALLAADCPDMPLKIKAHSRPSGKWGIHTYSFEFNKRRWYSPRGVPEKLDDIEAEITAQHRAKLNRMAIVNSPTFKYKPGRHINASVWKWFPGQMMPTSDPMGDVVPVVMQPLDQSFDSEIQFLNVWGENYLGGPDYGNTGNSTLSEARTATEIESINRQARQSLSMRGLLMKLAYNEVWNEWFDLWHSIGPEEVYVQVTGGDEPIRLTKEELQGKFLLQTTGTIGSTDPQLEAQKAQARIVILAQIQPLLGDRWEMDLGEAVVDWMEKDNIRLMKRVLRERSPEEIQQIQAEREQAAAQMANQQLAMAAAGQKPQTNGKAEAPKRNVAPMAPLGSRN